MTNKIRDACSSAWSPHGRHSAFYYENRDLESTLQFRAQGVGLAQEPCTSIMSKSRVASNWKKRETTLQHADQAPNTFPSLVQGRSRGAVVTGGEN